MSGMARPRWCVDRPGVAENCASSPQRRLRTYWRVPQKLFVDSGAQFVGNEAVQAPGNDGDKAGSTLKPSKFLEPFGSGFALRILALGQANLANFPENDAWRGVF
jgi:hypothetical protein